MPSALEEDVISGKDHCGFSRSMLAGFQRKGVGTALVKAVEAIAAGRDLDEVNLEVTTDNRDAIRLYRRLGYRKCGDPEMDRWNRMRDDGSSETIEVPVLVMVKRLV